MVLFEQNENQIVNENTLTLMRNQASTLSSILTSTIIKKRNKVDTFLLLIIIIKISNHFFEIRFFFEFNYFSNAFSRTFKGPPA